MCEMIWDWKNGGNQSIRVLLTRSWRSGRDPGSIELVLEVDLSDSGSTCYLLYVTTKGIYGYGAENKQLAAGRKSVRVCQHGDESAV